MRTRWMVAVFSTCAVLAAVSGAQADEPSQKTADALFSNLQDALRSGGEGEQVLAVKEAAGTEDPRIIKQLGRALNKKSPAVVEEAIRALGSMKSDAALKQLHKLYRSNRKLGENKDLFASLLKEIGRHGNKSSVEILADHPFRNLTRIAGKARLMGLGNIRHRDAVEALINAGQKAGGRGGRGLNSEWRDVFSADLELALRVLTGQDNGKIVNDWARWWQAEKKTFKMSKERPPIPEDLRRVWEQYWGTPYGTEDLLPSRGPNNTPLVRNDMPTPEDVAAAVKLLKDAFKSKDDATIMAALEQAGGVMDPKVVHELGRGLRYKSRAVKMVTIDTLGWMKYEPALKQLHRFFRRRKFLYKKDVEMFALTLKSIGRNGNKKSIDVLARHPFRGLTIASGRARILGLGRVRDKKAVEELIGGSQLTGELRPRGGRGGTRPRFDDEFLLSLNILTGKTFSKDRHTWQRWWQKNKRSFEVSDILPPLSEAMRKLYESYWGEPYDG